MGAASFISGPLYESRKNAYGHVVYGVQEVVKNGVQGCLKRQLSSRK